MTKAGWMLLIVGVGHLAGCGGDPPEEPLSPLPTLDSAGVEIIVNQGPDTVLLLDEVMRVGVVEGDPTYQFDRIRALAADRRGGLWVVDGHEAVRHYAPDGEYLGSVGARGVDPARPRNTQTCGRATPMWSHPATLETSSSLHPTAR